jgi:hypothetical protein
MGNRTSRQAKIVADGWLLVLATNHYFQDRNWS